MVIAPADYCVTPIRLHQVKRRHTPEEHNLIFPDPITSKLPRNLWFPVAVLRAPSSTSVQSTLRRNVFSVIIYRIW